MNPKLTKFLEDYPEMSLIGFAWACYWRMMLVVMAVYVVAVVAIAMFTFIVIGTQ